MQKLACSQLQQSLRKRARSCRVPGQQKFESVGFVVVERTSRERAGGVGNEQRVAAPCEEKRNSAYAVDRGERTLFGSRDCREAAIEPAHLTCPDSGIVARIEQCRDVVARQKTRPEGRMAPDAGGARDAPARTGCNVDHGMRQRRAALLMNGRCTAAARCTVGDDCRGETQNSTRATASDRSVGGTSRPHASGAWPRAGCRAFVGLFQRSTRARRIVRCAGSAPR